VILYLIGIAAFVDGAFFYWRDSVVVSDAFMVGTTCIVSAAGLQVVRDLWRRLRK
jgi:hypothetical protein